MPDKVEYSAYRCQVFFHSVCTKCIQSKEGVTVVVCWKGCSLFIEIGDGIFKGMSAQEQKPMAVVTSVCNKGTALNYNVVCSCHIKGDMFFASLIAANYWSNKHSLVCWFTLLAVTLCKLSDLSSKRGIVRQVTVNLFHTL